MASEGWTGLGDEAPLKCECACVLVFLRLSMPHRMDTAGVPENAEKNLSAIISKDGPIPYLAPSFRVSSHASMNTSMRGG